MIILEDVSSQNFKPNTHITEGQLGGHDMQCELMTRGGKARGLQIQSSEPTPQPLLFLKFSAGEGRGEQRESFSTSSQEPK